MADAAAPPIVVGRVRKPHGLKGELAIFPLTDDPEAVYVKGREVSLLDLGGKVVGTIQIEAARIYHRECLLRLENHSSRESVDAYRGLFLGVPREAMPPLADDEIYQQDLVGFAVRDEADEPLGIVSAVYDLPAGATIEVQGPQREFLLPYRTEYVKLMDREGRRLVVSVPDGLID